jgi:Na+/H+-dicarboxylate symporter
MTGEAVANEKAHGGPDYGRLQWRILIGFVLGLLAGIAAYTFARDAEWIDTVVTYVTNPLGQVFLRLLFMLVIPLLVSALVVGIADMGEIRALKKVGVRTLLYTVVVSSIAVGISIAVTNLIQPGAGVDPVQARALLAEGSEGAQGILERSSEAKTGVDAVIGLIPSNVVSAMGDNDILAVMFNLAAQFGWDMLVKLAAFVAVVLLALGLQLFGVFPLLLAFLARKNPLTFFRETREASVMAFSTSSSNATLPTALRVAETRLKLPPRISRFVLTIGATANQNGTAMFEGVTVLFLAQFFGVDLTLGDQIFVMLVCILAGIGTAGVPGGSLPVIALILGGVGVPPEGIGLILGVDRFLDMCRTVLNVIGDLVAATVISAHSGDVTERGEAEVPIPSI